MVSQITLDFGGGVEEKSNILSKEILIEQLGGSNGGSKKIELYYKSGQRFTEKNGYIFITHISGAFNSILQKVEARCDENGWYIELQSTGSDIIKGGFRAFWLNK